MKDGWPSSSPLTRVPGDRREVVAVVTKHNRAKTGVGAHFIKRENNLSPLLRPVAMLHGVVSADVEGGQDRRAIGGQGKGIDTFRRIARRRIPLIGTCKIDHPLFGGHGDAGGCNEPADRYQVTGWRSGGAHDE